MTPGLGRSQASLDLVDPAAPRLERFEPDQWPLAPGWRDVVGEFFGSVPGRALTAYIRQRLADGATIYPPHPLRALELTPLDSVHAVVLGQDPYHGPGQAEGLAFSVPAGVRPPPSLRNIFQELGETPTDGSLMRWARSGVLLLNASLTVEAAQAGSHAGRGWEALTDRLLARVASSASPCVYLLWGAHAQAKAALIESEAGAHGREALVLRANHPSPLSARRPPLPFIGCGHFAQARHWLAERGVRGIF